MPFNLEASDLIIKESNIFKLAKFDKYSFYESIPTWPEAETKIKGQQEKKSKIFEATQVMLKIKKEESNSDGNIDWNMDGILVRVHTIVRSV